MEEGRIVITHADLPPDLPPDLPLRQLPPSRRDPLAVASAVLGLGSILFAGVALGPAAIVTGLLALRRARFHRGARGVSSLPWLGLVAGLVGTVLWAGAIRWYLTRPRDLPGNPAQQVWLGFSPGATDLSAVERAPFAIRRALLANVSLVVEKAAGTGWSVVATGSGVTVVSEPGNVAVLTCLHVLQPGLPAGFEKGGYRLRAGWLGGGATDLKVLWTSRTPVDLALLRVPAAAGATLPAAVPPGDWTRVGIGDDVFAVGDPLNFRTSLVRGTLSAMRTPESGTPVATIQAQIPLNPGNSGGGLYNRDGELLGLNSWTMAKEKAEGMGFSISIVNLRTSEDTMGPEARAIVDHWLGGPDGPPRPGRR